MDSVQEPFVDKFSILSCGKGTRQELFSCNKPFAAESKIKALKIRAVMPRMNRKISLNDIPATKSISSVQRRFQKAIKNSLNEPFSSQTFQNVQIIAEIPIRKRTTPRAYPYRLFLSTFLISVPNPS